MASRNPGCGHDSDNTMKTDKPNILVIQADQLNTGSIGAYRNRLAQTPC